METQVNEEFKVRLLYKDLLDSWNTQNAETFAGLFAADGNAIGFDGSQMNGRTSIHEELGRIFAQHKVASYVGIIREVRLFSPTVYMLRAVAGMLPPGKSDINPAVNAIQTLIAKKEEVRQKEEPQFQIALFQNTPAAFHGRPELAQQLTAELQEAANQFFLPSLPA
jgi:uncharacterized protein (TIGR02246 family)